MDRALDTSTRLRLRLRRWLVPVAGLTVAAVAVVWLIGQLRPGFERTRIRTGRVERGPIEAVLNATGTVQPAAEQVIASPIEGRVLRVLRHPGTVVEEGEPILDLDASASRLELERLEGEILRLEAGRRELEARLEAELDEKESQQRIRRLDVEQLTYQEEQHRRLHQQGLVSETALEQQITLTEKARIELEAVGRSLIGTRRRLEAQIGSLEAELAVRREERDATLGRLERATTRADRRGVLTWVLDEEGAAVREGDVLARIADLDRFRVEATLSEVHASKLRGGQRARVLLGDELRIEGRVTRVFPAVEERAVRFQVELDESSHPELRANRRVDVLLITDSAAGVLTVPKGPYLNGVGLQRVFVIDGDGDRAVRRRVRIGRSGWDRHEVLDGLAVGDEVVLSDTADYIHLEEVPLR